MQTSLMPSPNQQFLDSNGDPLAGGKLYLYEPGTSAAKAAYTSSAGTTELSNPVILDSAGRKSIWLDGYYKMILKDSDDTTIWTIDNVSGQYSDELTDFQYILQTDTLTYISGTQFSIVDDKTDTYQVGRRLKAVVTAGTIYGTITASSSGGTPVITTVTCLWDSGALDSGISTVSLGVITPTNESLPIHVPGEKAANYSAAVTDIGKLIQSNSANAISITLLAANAVPAGSTLNVQNIGAGLMTLVGTVNAQSNRTFLQHEGVDLYSDGAAWRAHRLQDEPVGAFKWWNKSLTGVPQTLPWGWVECSGQTLSDADSPLNGQVVPNINGDGRFIRGSNTSGNEQANQNLEHTHTPTISGTGANDISVNLPANTSWDEYLSSVGYPFANGFSYPVANASHQPVGANMGGMFNVSSNDVAANLTATNSNSGSTESRPVNVSMVAIMKVK